MRIQDRGCKNWDPGWKKLGFGINIPDPQHCLEYLEDLDKDPHGMVQEGLVLRMGDNEVKTVAQLLHRLQLVLVLRL